MSDLIDRKHLIKNLNRFAPEHYSALINSLILKEPTVDAEPVRHGHIEADGYTYTCSACESRLFEHDLFWRYCPYCGAKLDDERGKPCDDCQEFDCHGCKYAERKEE